jgi:hypothetical protein
MQRAKLAVGISSNRSSPSGVVQGLSVVTLVDKSGSRSLAGTSLAAESHNGRRLAIGRRVGNVGNLPHKGINNFG